MRKIYSELILVIVVIGGLWFGFSQLSCNIDNFSIVSKEQEKKLGDLLLKEITKTNKKVTHKYVEASIKQIKTRLLKQLPKPLYNYNIIVVENSDINAFTLPGGNIVIFSGLIDFVKDIDELIAVLAHELGHAEEKHIHKRMVRLLGLKVVSLLLGGLDSSLIHEALQLLLSSSFDRKQEKKADLFALKLMVKASINPKGLPAFFRRLLKEENSNIIPEIVSTHPSHEERIKHALAFTIPEDFKEKRINVNWKYLQRIIKKINNTKK